MKFPFVLCCPIQARILFQAISGNDSISAQGSEGGLGFVQFGLGLGELAAGALYNFGGRLGGEAHVIEAGLGGGDDFLKIGDFLVESGAFGVEVDAGGEVEEGGAERCDDRGLT